MLRLECLLPTLETHVIWINMNENVLQKAHSSSPQPQSSNQCQILPNVKEAQSTTEATEMFPT